MYSNCFICFFLGLPFMSGCVFITGLLLKFENVKSLQLNADLFKIFYCYMSDERRCSFSVPSLNKDD